MSEVLASQVQAAAARYRRVGRMAEGWARGKLSRDPAFEAVLAHLPEEGRLVDVGCGEGYLLALAREARPRLELFGFDHDGRRVAQGLAALQGEERLSLRVADARSVDLPQAHCIACLDVLHYLPPAEQDQVVARMARALVPGGLLLVRDGVEGSGLRSALTRLSEQLLVGLGRHLGDGVFFRANGALHDTMSKAGLVVRVQSCAQGTPFANVLLVGERTE